MSELDARSERRSDGRPSSGSSKLAAFLVGESVHSRTCFVGQVWPLGSVGVGGRMDGKGGEGDASSFELIDRR